MITKLTNQNLIIGTVALCAVSLFGTNLIGNQLKSSKAQLRSNLSTMALAEKAYLLKEKDKEISNFKDIHSQLKAQGNGIVVNENEPTSIIEERDALIISEDLFNTYLKNDYEWWIQNFELASKTQKDIISYRKKLNLNTENIENMNLKINLILSIIMNINMNEVNTTEEFELTSSQWALINNFVNSGDFEKMIKYKSLTPGYIDFDNLAIYYNNKRSVVSNDTTKDLKKSVREFSDSEISNEENLE